MGSVKSSTAPTDMRVVVALGGSALFERGEKPDVGVAVLHVPAGANALAPIAAEHDRLICPLVGMHTVEGASDSTLTRPYPLDGLAARTQEVIGFWLIQSLPGAGKTRQKLADRHCWSIAVNSVPWLRVAGLFEPQPFIGTGLHHRAGHRCRRDLRRSPRCRGHRPSRWTPDGGRGRGGYGPRGGHPGHLGLRSPAARPDRRCGSVGPNSRQHYHYRPLRSCPA